MDLKETAVTVPLTTDAGRRYAFAPHPDPIHDILYRIHIIFEEPDGRLWSSGTDLMAPDMASAETLAEDLNSRLELDDAEWRALAERVFASKRIRPGNGDQEPSSKFPQ